MSLLLAVASVPPIDVKVSWLQLDTSATPVDFKVSWLQLDTSATPVDVKVSWLQLDTAATPCDVRVSWCQFDTAASRGVGGGGKAKRRKDVLKDIKRLNELILSLPTEPVIVKKASQAFDETDDEEALMMLMA